MDCEEMPAACFTRPGSNHLAGMFALLLVFLAVGGAASAQGMPAFQIRTPAGPFPVGLKVVEQYDYSRVFQPEVDSLGKPYEGERARPIQTLIWYPAQAGAAPHMVVGDYVALSETEASFGRPRLVKGPANYFWSGIAPSFPEPMAATREAAAAPGRFPLVIYAPSFSSGAWENADLCEFLASWGYVVIASPGMGVGRESTHDLAGVDAQARDISFLIGFARSLPDADVSHVAVVGFSWGGLSNLFAAQRDDRIQALVDLEGSIRYWPGLVKSGDVDPSKLAIPLLYFKQEVSLEGQAGLEQNFKAAAGPSVLNQWTGGDLYSIQMLRMVHPEFGSLTFRNTNLWNFEMPRLQWGDYDREDGIESYAWVARYTRAFLDAYLKTDADARAFLNKPPADVGVPRHTLAVSFHAGRGKPYDLAEFRQTVGRAGFDHLGEVFEAARKAHPEVALGPSELGGWERGLMSEGHAAEALAVAKLVLKLEPSVGAYRGLGAAYLALGQTKEAADAYRTALAKDPKDLFAQAALAQIEGAKVPPAGAR
jgi:dienelactone hydrolase